MEDHEREDSVEGLKEQTARELFSQLSNISLCMSYDLIDKLRWWEKEVMKLSDDEISKHIPHLSACLDQLKTTYLQFAEIDF